MLHLQCLDNLIISSTVFLSSGTWAYRGLRNRRRHIPIYMSLDGPFLPYQDIPHVFRELQTEATTERVSDLVQYIPVNWINGTAAPKDWSIYGEAMRTNNEGSHNAPVMSEKTPSPGKAAVSKTPTVNVEGSVPVAQKTGTSSV